MDNKEHDIKKESISQENSDWTEERMNEIFKVVKESRDRVAKEWAALTEEERERRYNEPDNCRFWEDFTDVNI